MTAAYAIQVRGGPEFVARFRDGDLIIEPADSRPVDCHILADPVAFLLVAYGRISQWGPMLHGETACLGTKALAGLEVQESAEESVVRTGSISFF